MRKFIRARIAALAFGLSLAGVPAFAADDQRDHERNGQDANQNHQQNHDQNNKGNHGDHKPPIVGTQHNGAQNGNGNQTGWKNTRHDDNRNFGNQNRGNDNRNFGDRNRGDNGPNFTSNHRPNFDVSRYRQNMESPRRFRIGVYHAPRGYYYRRWSYGQRLPIEFYARDFWLTDFVAFGLFAPPPGCIWVRYGPDALLIDEDTGEIIQVRYDVFYS